MQEIDEAQLKAWDDYIAKLKAIYKNLRWFGILMCFIGVGLYLGAVWLNLPEIFAKIGIGMIGFGWVVLAFVIVKRSIWARKNRPKMN